LAETPKKWKVGDEFTINGQYVINPPDTFERFRVLEVSEDEGAVHLLLEPDFRWPSLEAAFREAEKD
jgi:hypothetical protein